MKFDTTPTPRTPGKPPATINWNLLTAGEAGDAWLELNAWLNWLRRTYGLPATVLPPFWYRHPELVWELSALHSHWLASYDRDQVASAPLAWHHDFALAQARLRDWVAAAGTRLDRDRPTRQTVWPGETPRGPIEERTITNRDDDFVEFVRTDIAQRQETEDAFIAATGDALPR